MKKLIFVYLVLFSFYNVANCQNKKRNIQELEIIFKDYKTGNNLNENDELDFENNENEDFVSSISEIITYFKYDSDNEEYDSKINNYVNYWLVSTINIIMNFSVSENNLGDYNDFLDYSETYNNIEDSFSFFWEPTISYSLDFDKKTKYLTFLTSSFNGGTGNYASNNEYIIIIDNNSGKTVTSSDIIKDTIGLYQYLYKLAENEIGNRLSNKYKNYEYEDEQADIEPFIISNTFYIQDDSLIFDYPKYTFSSHPFGFEIKIPKEEILPYLKFNPWE